MLSSFQKFFAGLRLDATSEEMAREQYKTLTRTIPFLYTVCIGTCIALMATFSRAAPAWLAYWIPGSVAAIMLVRRQFWLKQRGTEYSADIASIRRNMLGTAILGPVFTFAFSVTGVLLMGYANPYQESLCVVAIWITAIASAFCLSVLPIASVTVVISSAIPLIVAFVLSGSTQMIIIAGIFAVVSAMMIYILLDSFNRFAEILNSRTLIDERQRQTEAARQAVTEMAYTDTLTNLPNRRAFERLLSERVAMTTSGVLRCFTVGMVDLDGFKPINDAYGHVVGDEVLVQASRRLMGAMKGFGAIARVGGDEFAIIVDNIEGEAEISDLAQRLTSAFSDPIIVGSITTRLACSCGFAPFPGSGQETSRLIDRADMALYRAKAERRGSFCIFSASLEKAALERASIEQELRLAVAADALTVHFQPIVDLKTGRLAGFEALARWTHPELGNVSPAIFVPIAEQTGLIETMTDRLLFKAARIAAQWPADLMLAFNLSAYQVGKPNAGLRIIRMLAEAGLPPHRLEAEITETAILQNIEASRQTIETLKAAGVRISLDDFGTGFSSLSHVKDLPLDKIKIDKSFVDRVCHDDKIGNIVRSIINMCEFLDLACVAEGIEHSEQLDFLKDNKCSGGQGYLFSRPIPTDRVDTLLKDIAARRTKRESSPAAAQAA
ncbi:MAG TPA: EAL domain-containing protein [Beijerinckiaceae bacterium]|nr:EAL domain-containing protein [Beijerinckiaceae bacterium]